jgi:hypothetical protein
MTLNHMNSVSKFTHEYKKCAGKNCDKLGTIMLRIRYIHKTGAFCDFCANDLTGHDLAIKIDDN